jgi:hypothetical protein
MERTMAFRPSGVHFHGAAFWGGKDTLDELEI